MLDSVIFYARSVHSLSSDRIYRVELRNDALYFLRVGGQYNVDRGGPPDPGTVVAGVILSVAEGLFRKHKQEELLARDITIDPEDLLRIHPHNFKLLPAVVRRATILPKKWFLALFRRHFGRLIFELEDGKRWEFHFEHIEDLRIAIESLPSLLGPRLEITR